LYIAGSSSAVPRPGRANSGYLLRGSGALAVDFGSGVLSRLREQIEPTELDAILISHMHADHFFDLVPLRYALRYEMKRKKPLPVFLPPGGIKTAQSIGRPLKESADFYEGVLDLREYSARQPVRVGGYTIHFAPALHYITAYAMRVESGSNVFGYSADTAPCRTVCDLVRGADVFLCEAALGPRGIERGRRGHLNAREAGELAQRAGVRHLVLTHYSAKTTAGALREAAAQAYSGQITVADDGMEIAF
jgi:ribonuclease BN (tRNA processing enzyme)